MSIQTSLFLSPSPSRFSGESRSSNGWMFTFRLFEAMSMATSRTPETFSSARSSTVVRFIATTEIWPPWAMVWESDWKIAEPPVAISTRDMSLRSGVP
ncbi:hypothetical protein D3C85_364770 [compost metagenome]